MIVLLILIPLLFFFWFTGRYNNPYKLFLLLGLKGSGKSSRLVQLALKYMKKGWIVYSNMPDIMVPGVRIFNDDHLGDYVPVANSVLLIDEAGMKFDSRDFKNFKASTRDFFKLQRHHKCIVYLASQANDVDKKIRDLLDGMYLHIKKFNVFSVGKRIVRTIKLTEPTSESDSRIADELQWGSILSWTFTYIPKYSKYFDSFILEKKPELPYIEVKAKEVSKSGKNSDE